MGNENINIIEKFFITLYRIRRVEEEIARIYPSDKIKSPVHLSIGQESISVGICEALTPRDVVFGSYRSHALYLAKGGDLKKMIAELYGKETGCAKGKGGSMHLIDIESGVMGTSAIVGTTIPLAVGYAMGLKYYDSKNIVASFFGDGAVDEGVFYESINFAALKKLPILFVCENNFYAIHSPQLARQSKDNLLERARSYGLVAFKIEDGDVFKIYQLAQDCIKKIRSGSGPIFLELNTYRWKEHVGPNDDFHLGYRDESEILFWRENDPLLKLETEIETSKLENIKSKVNEEIKEAFDFADRSPFPEAFRLYEDVFKE